MICPICKAPVDVIVSAFSQSPFVDGRIYEYICHACASVPKQHEVHGDELVVYDYLTPDRLYTEDEMIADGWDRDTARHSISAVKRAIKNSKVDVNRGLIVLDTLFGIRIEHDD